MTHKKLDVTLLGVLVLALATLYYFYELFLRVILGTIATEIMFDLHLGAEQFALIGSAYYLTYSIMQTPVGILVDRYGVRILLSLACIICNVGVFGFAFANGFMFALICRFLIGLGSAFAFVSILMLALNWFPRHLFAFLAGLIQFLGSIGPFLGGAPLSYMLSKMNNNWRLALIYIGIFGIVLNLLIALFVRTFPKGNKADLIFLQRGESLFKKLKELVKNVQVWWTVFFAGCIYSAMPVLGAFWGTSYLRSRGFDRGMSAFIISMIWIGLAVGCPSIGKLSDSMKRRKSPLIFVSLLGVFVSSFVLYSRAQSEILLCSLFFLIGFACSGQSLSFAIITEHVPKKLHATAIGLNNSMITFFATIVPPIVSILIQSASPANAKVFSEAAFEKGLLVLPICYFLAFLLVIFGVKETFCRQQNELFPLEREF